MVFKDLRFYITETNYILISKMNRGGTVKLPVATINQYDLHIDEEQKYFSLKVNNNDPKSNIELTLYLIAKGYRVKVDKNVLLNSEIHKKNVVKESDEELIVCRYNHVNLIDASIYVNERLLVDDLQNIRKKYIA